MFFVGFSAVLMLVTGHNCYTGWGAVNKNNKKKINAFAKMLGKGLNL